MEHSLTLQPNDKHYHVLLEYIYDNYSDNINDIVYNSDSSVSRYEFRFRKFKDRQHIKSILPNTCDFSFSSPIHSIDTKFHCSLKIIYQPDGNPVLYLHNISHEGQEHRILKQLKLSSTSKDNLITFIDIARATIKEKHEENKKSTNETIRIFYYQKEFWNMLSKAPKRPIETLYLKEGEKENIISMIDDFFNPQTRELYLSFGMPYKHIIMLYGIPGSGKTSTISAIASYFDCDIYTIPITKELTDYGLIDAFSYVNDSEDKKRIIVLEDIDCIFDTTRKEGDEHNMLTLQSLLNCLDGHTCVEGTLLFMTANNPEKMDYAMVRSCRIDYKLELGYADEYQTRSIYNTFLPDQCDKFNSFYKKIKHKQFTTAMLQEHLFYNRKCDNIIDHMDKFMSIIEKNKPCELSTNKKDENLYM